MDERQGDPGLLSRRARLRALPTPADVELYVEDERPLLEVIDELPEPRIADLDALLREVDDLRSSLRRDLGLAATAAEAGADEMAGWLLLNEDGEVRSFEQRALAHLSNLEAAEAADDVPAVVPAQRKHRRMLPAAPLVAACAAVFGFLTGSVPGAPGSPSTTNVALDSYAVLTDLATSGASERSIREAAERFHADLAPLVAAAHTDPVAAQKAIALLQSERAVIASNADSPALRAVLRQADALVAKLRAKLPRASVRPLVVVPQDDAQPERKQTRSTASPKPTASPKASPSASPKASPSPSATPSPSPSDDGPLPPAPTSPLK